MNIGMKNENIRTLHKCIIRRLNNFVSTQKISLTRRTLHDEGIGKQVPILCYLVHGKYCLNTIYTYAVVFWSDILRILQDHRVFFVG